MAWHVRLVEGRTAQVRVRARPDSFSFSQLLNRIREHSGIPPIRLRDVSNADGDVLEYRDIAIYLADFYPRVPHEELAAYFSADLEWVRRICRDPYGTCNLRILAELQQKIEKSLNLSLALNVETDRMLTLYEQYDLMEEIDRGACSDDFYVSETRSCVLQRADDRAFFELEEYYREKGFSFDEELYCNSGHSSRWNVCPWEP